MTKKESKLIIDKIVKGFNSSIDKVYLEANKNNLSLVISENGKIKTICPGKKFHIKNKDLKSYPISGQRQWYVAEEHEDYKAIPPRKKM